MDQTAHVVGEVLQPYPSLRPRQPDTTQQRPAHVVALGPENMLDADPNGRTGLVALLLALAQRLVAAGFAMDPALQPLLLQRRLDLRRAISAVRPYAQGRVVPIQDIVENLTVVRRRVAHLIAPHQLVPTVHVDMVLVAVMAPAVLLGPPRIDILLAPLCRLILPAFRRLASLYPAFSLRLLRCLGTATIEASMIWPPIAR